MYDNAIHLAVLERPEILVHLIQCCLATDKSQKLKDLFTSVRAVGEPLADNCYRTGREARRIQFITFIFHASTSKNLNTDPDDRRRRGPHALIVVFIFISSPSFPRSR